MTCTIWLPAGRQSQHRTLCWKTASNNSVELNLKLCIQGTLNLGSDCNIKKSLFGENTFCALKLMWFYYISSICKKWHRWVIAASVKCWFWYDHYELNVISLHSYCFVICSQPWLVLPEWPASAFMTFLEYRFTSVGLSWLLPIWLENTSITCLQIL